MELCQPIACVAAVIGLWFSRADALAQPSLFQTNRPVLQVSASNSGVMVSWPLASIESTLETTTDPQSGAWAAVTNLPSATGDYLHVVTPPGESSRFFRLNGTNWVPSFQFPACYGIDLEIGTGPTMTMTGRADWDSTPAGPGDSSRSFRRHV